MKILDVAWRTGYMGTFGVVAVERVDGWKAYLGSCLSLGHDSDYDAMRIAEHGAPLMEPEARGFFPNLKDITYAY